MACVSPPELSDEQLLTYVNGEADETIANHLERCEHCRVRAEDLARMRDRLAARLFRITCPTSISLGEYHLGLLEAGPAAAIRRHLGECPHCAREVAQLKSYLADLAPTIELSPMERAKALVARLIGGKREDPSPGEPVFAPAMAGIRGDTKGPITLEADGILIVLDVQPASEGRVTILGQIASDDLDRWIGAKVELSQAGVLRLTATVDDLGAFRCEAFPAQPTELLITPSSGSALLIPNVEIVV